MAEQKTRKRPAAKRSPARSARAATTPAAKKQAAAKAPPAAEQGADGLYRALLQEVRAAVLGVEVRPNKSGTYSRLLTKTGRAFAYVFPPRKGGVALKIPKQLLAVERELPEGHGFKVTGWGLTRTLKDPAETAVVARALGVAAKAASK